MTRETTITRHRDRVAIEQELVRGAPLRNIAERFGVSVTALHRHRQRLPRHLADARQAREAARADALLEQLHLLHQRALGLLDDAEAAGDHRTALSGIREARACLELLAKLSGELDERSQVNILVAPEWTSVRNAILDALAPHPEATAAVVLRLEALGAV